MDQLGPYRIEKRLGQGGMGKVYQAVDPSDGRSVAIKSIQTGLTDSSLAFRRFEREVKLLSRLDHPVVPKVFEVLNHRGFTFVVMELIEGFTLDSVMERGPLPLGDALYVGREVADGLAAAHRQRIVHRDVKGRNVMVSHAGNVKVLDFGVARVIEEERDSSVDLTRTGVIIGSAQSLAPEQALGEPVDHRADLFSLGVLLYRMLTGQQPFQAKNFIRLLAEITAKPHRPAHQVARRVPEEISEYLDVLLSKNPADRPSSTQDVVAALSTFSDSYLIPPFDPKRLSRQSAVALD